MRELPLSRISASHNELHPSVVALGGGDGHGLRVRQQRDEVHLLLYSSAVVRAFCITKIVLQHSKVSYGKTLSS
jgi:hypothetical protein